ncbi:hypothetical protein Tco_0386369 [Tanacetum coccineum]
MIQSAINESLKNVVLDNSSSQLKSTYKAAASLTEFELKKILLDKIQKSKSYRAAPEHKELYDGLVKSYKLDKDLFESYGKTYSLKRKIDEDKSVQAEEPVFEVADTEMSQDQGGDLGNTEDQTNVKAAPKHDWFKKPKRPLTPHPAWNDGKSIDFRPPQTWISIIAQAEKPPHSFNKLMSTPIDFSSYEIQVQREDQKLYKFKEGDFPRLNLRNIEDLLLFLVQKKLFNLEKDVIYNLNMALRMFTKRVVILKRVEDLQLGVKSYQKKLNITKLETFRSDISNLTPYTACNNPQGIIYQDKLERNRLMRSDELYKFFDGTLTSVQRVLHDIASNMRMDYLPKRN